MTVQYSPASAPLSPHPVNSLFLAFLASLARQCLFHVSQMVAARLPLRRICRYEIAILDLQMDAQADRFEKCFATWDRRSGLTFANLVDKSEGFLTALHSGVHQSRPSLQVPDDYPHLRKLLNRTRGIAEKRSERGKSAPDRRAARGLTPRRHPKIRPPQSRISQPGFPSAIESVTLVSIISVARCSHKF